MSEKLNVICLGIFNFPIGMAGTKRVRSFVDVLSENKNDVNIISFGVSELETKNKSKGFYNRSVYRNFGVSLSSTTLYYILLPYYIFCAAYLILSWKKKESKNIIYSYGGTSIEIFILICWAKLIGYKIVIDIVEDYETFYEKKSFILTLKLKTIVFFEKRISYYTDAIVVISAYLEKLYKKRVKADIPILIIPVSTEIDETTAQKKKYFDVIRFCYSGTFGSKDGVETLVRTFEKFNKEYRDAELLMIGAGSNMNNILNMTKNENIKYCGCLTDEYTGFIRNTDVLFMTRVDSVYASAGFPYKLGEYLSTANPVVCTDVSDISVYLENKVDCIIIKPEDEDELFKAMEFLVKNPEQAFEIGYNGYQKAKKYFNAKTNGEMLKKLMNQM